MEFKRSDCRMQWFRGGAGFKKLIEAVHLPTGIGIDTSREWTDEQAYAELKRLVETQTE